MMRIVNIFRADYTSDYQYRKAVGEYRRSGYIVAKVCGGVKCFESFDDFENWKRQK